MVPILLGHNAFGSCILEAHIFGSHFFGSNLRVPYLWVSYLLLLCLRDHFAGPISSGPKSLGNISLDSMCLGLISLCPIILGCYTFGSHIIGSNRFGSHVLGPISLDPISLGSITNENARIMDCVLHRRGTITVDATECVVGLKELPESTHWKFEPSLVSAFCPSGRRLASGMAPSWKP